MNRGQEYENRKNYIEKLICGVMAAKKDFESIQYARSGVTDREFVRVRDIFGKAVTIEITGETLEKVLSDICRIILTGEEKVSVPAGIITDKDELRKAVRLFK